MPVFVFEPTDRVRVAEALDVLEAREADTVAEVDEVFEDNAERVPSVCDGWLVELRTLLLIVLVIVFEIYPVAV